MTLSSLAAIFTVPEEGLYRVVSVCFARHFRLQLLLQISYGKNYFLIH